MPTLKTPCALHRPWTRLIPSEAGPFQRWLVHFLGNGCSPESSNLLFWCILHYNLRSHRELSHKVWYEFVWIDMTLIWYCTFLDVNEFGIRRQPPFHQLSTCKDPPLKGCYLAPLKHHGRMSGFCFGTQGPTPGTTVVVRASQSWSSSQMTEPQMTHLNSLNLNTKSDTCRPFWKDHGNHFDQGRVGYDLAQTRVWKCQLRKMVESQKSCRPGSKLKTPVSGGTLV